jgi:hypothetical protein
MPRKKVKTKKPKSQTEQGRELLKEQKQANVTAVSGFAIDEMVQYYDDGWRAGYVRELPVRGKHRGLARVENLVSKKRRQLWIDGTCLRKLERAHEDSSLPRPLGAAVPL